MIFPMDASEAIGCVRMSGEKSKNAQRKPGKCTHSVSLISGIANLKTQGILQIDWKESRSVYSQQSRDEMFILVMWTVGQGSQSKMGLLVSAFECLGATVSLFYSLKKNILVKKSNDYKWCENVQTEIYKLFDSSTFHAPSVMMIFIFSPLWHNMPWYMIWYDMIWYEENVPLLLYFPL